MNRVFLLCYFALLLLLSSRATAQNKFDKIWLQGDQLLFTSTFNSGSVTNDTIGLKQWIFHHGHSDICDSFGRLVLACDGYNLYDKNLNRVENGDSIVPDLLYKKYSGSSIVVQSSIILPFANGRYLVITPAASDSMVNNCWNPLGVCDALFDLLLYDEVDMTANGGLGKVTKKKAPLLANVRLSKTQMMACRHGDGKSWWLLKQASDTNLIYKFLLTDSLIYGPYIQGFAEPHFTKWDICGQAMFSKDGTKYATTIQGFKKIFLADFDRCSGALTNPKIYDVPIQSTQNPFDSTQRDSSTCGLCFSPSGRLLYVNGFFTVQQLDLQNNNLAAAWTLLSGPDTAWQEFQEYSNIYPGPDGKLYVGNWNGLGGQMSVINYPDVIGISAGFCSKCLRFPGLFFQGVVRNFCVTSPPCMPNYHLEAMNPICYPTGVQPISTDHPFLLYPNPSRGTIEVKYEAAGELRLYDVTGREVNISPLLSPGNRIISIDISHLPAGAYMYQYWRDRVLSKSGKLIIAF